MHPISRVILLLSTAMIAFGDPDPNRQGVEDVIFHLGQVMFFPSDNCVFCINTAHHSSKKAFPVSEFLFGLLEI